MVNVFVHFMSQLYFSCVSNWLCLVAYTSCLNLHVVITYETVIRVLVHFILLHMSNNVSTLVKAIVVVGALDPVAQSV